MFWMSTTCPFGISFRSCTNSQADLIRSRSILLLANLATLFNQSLKPLTLRLAFSFGFCAICWTRTLYVRLLLSACLSFKTTRSEIPLIQNLLLEQEVKNCPTKPLREFHKKLYYYEEKWSRTILWECLLLLFLHQFQSAALLFLHPFEFSLRDHLLL